MAHDESGAIPRIIDAVERPGELHALTDDELAIVADEIRGEIVSTVSRTGGHLASSLGAVETIVALHAELDCPPDRIVYDVGHQAYAHKILTGRLASFSTLRQEGGVSGFPTPLESPYDAHPSGHASDSLSVALGLALARDLRGSSERVVALIGDASISGGMAFEALNQIGQDQTRLVVVLNDNGMSISPNVGALARHLGNLRTSDAYRDRRDLLLRRLEGAGPAAQAALALTRSARGSVKQLLLPASSMLFEQLGITCLAPVDGHDIPALRRALRQALASHGPTLVHVVTRKGAGYPPAERAPETFHRVGSFDPATGEGPATASEASSYADVLGELLLREARLDERVVAITAAMRASVGLAAFARELPSRCVDVGIAEEHAVGLAAGLAAGGMRPVVAIHSTFLQRAVDQLAVDVALPALDVVFCVGNAGVVGEDGSTHQGAFDLAYLRMLPNMRVLAPSDAAEFGRALCTALALGGPVAIRYPRDLCPASFVADDAARSPLVPGVSRVLAEGDDVAILALGSMVGPALEAARLLADADVSARVVDLRWAKPLDVGAVRAAAGTRLVVTVEEAVRTGGIGEGVLGLLADEGMAVPTLCLGLPDRSVPHGRRADLLEKLGLDGRGIAAAVLVRLAEEP